MNSISLFSVLIVCIFLFGVYTIAKKLVNHFKCKHEFVKAMITFIEDDRQYKCVICKKCKKTLFYIPGLNTTEEALKTEQLWIEASDQNPVTVLERY